MLLVLEGVCGVCGWGSPRESEDPFVGFAAIHPLFVPSEDGARYEVPPSRRRFFAAESFPAEKGPRDRRIFCLGGSTVQGNPYSIATSFTTWLELALNVADEDHNWDAINCGGISYASYRLVPILEECLRHEPDLIVLCTGQNEFLEDRTYGKLRESPWTASPVWLWLAERRVVNVVRGLIEPLSRRLRHDAAGSDTLQPATILAADTEPMLDYHNGLAAYHRDDAWREGVMRHYALNVQRMVRSATRAGVPVILMQPSCNLRDCPPFKWELPEHVSEQLRAEWESLVGRAHQQLSTDPLAGLTTLERALQIDPDNPWAWYLTGQCSDRLLDYGRARTAYVRAKDCDVCPLRILTPMEADLRRLAEREHVPLLDIHALLESRSPTGILGNDWLVDHIHPSIEGHQLIGETLVPMVAAVCRLKLVERWETPARAEFAKHFASLPSGYFLSGQNHLRGLRAWSQGRADGPPAAARYPHRITEQP
jgi:hypothetical protein